MRLAATAAGHHPALSVVEVQGVVFTATVSVVRYG